ncbi:HAD family hydrolase [Maridesulfovibrio bastinii]|uniref:HAD family hydrolase n=1 Tax=Maridesulfovibrio bastinii TaxID=47157 RepID=UPI0003FDAC0B|nr:HAD-IA family hydrolase [Maridesulfovibrio bastinii]
MKNRQIEAIVFDFDGTLAHLTIDFEKMKSRLNDLANVFVDDMPDAQDYPALEWIEKVSGYIKESDPETGKQFNTRCRFLVTSMEIEAAQNGGMFSYSVPLLKMLKNEGIKTAVISRNSASAIKTVCPEITKLNECVLAREDVKLVKPNPYHLNKALELLGVSKENTIMVGDHHMDIQTAKNAGTMSAGVASGRISIEELKKSEPDFVAETCEDLVLLLRENNLL